MAPLRQRMTEDMQVRNLSPYTQTCYVQQVSLFARHFRTSPEVLGPEDIRSYLVYLTNEKKLAPGSVLIAVAALRFLYRVTLHKDWSFQYIILDFFRLFKDGKRYRRLMEGFQRVFGATMFFGTNDEPHQELVLDWTRFHFFDHLRLWFHKVEAEPTPSSHHENCAVLSEAFYDEIDQHRIPAEREVVAALANAPGVLDLFCGWYGKLGL